MQKHIHQLKQTSKFFIVNKDIHWLCYFIFILIFLFSCIQHQEQPIPSSFHPKIVEAHGYVVPLDSMAEPNVILVDESKLKKVPVGKPKAILIHSNIHQVGTPKVVRAGIPRVCTPGQDTFLLPKKVLAIDSPFLAGIPEVVMVKDASTSDPNPLSLTSYGPLQGLKQSNVSCMLEDRFGNLWISINNEGVSKYDGKYFIHYTVKEGLSHNWVYSMIEDRSGNIWFGTAGGGVTKYDGKYFTHFTQKEGLCNNYVSSIVEDKSGNIWFATFGSGVSRYDGKFFTNFSQKEGLSSYIINCVYEDRSGNLWFGTFDGGACKYDGKTFTHFTEKEGLPYNLVSCILEDKSGNLWFGTRGFGISKYDGTSFTHFTEKEGLSINDVTSILEDKSGNLWLTTGGGGVNKYDGKYFTHFTGSEGLSHNRVWNSLEDKSGNLWFGTAFGGVNKYVEGSFTHLTEKEGLISNEVLSILEDKSGNLWFGSDGGGVSKYDGISLVHFTEKEGFSAFDVMSILEDHSGNLWFGTWGGGLIKYDGHFFTHMTEKDGSSQLNAVSSLVEDRFGNIWFGSEGGGVMKYDGKSLTHFTVKQGLSGGIVRSIIEDQHGNLWFGTWGGGISKYDGKFFSHFTKKEGLSSNVIRSILEDKSGNLWFGTWGEGLIKYDGKYFTNYTENEGLSDNSVVSSIEDQGGNLWFGTRFGLSKISKDKLSGVEIDTAAIKAENRFFTTYTYDDGFLGIGCRGNSLYQDHNGTIWIGTNDRLTAYRSPIDEVAKDTLPPNIQLTGLQLFNENISWANLEKKKDSTLILGNGIRVGHFKFDSISKWYGLPEHLSLSYFNNSITFRYIGITMHQPKRVKYQYKLDGNDENWSSMTSQTEAPYGNLSPGKYTFKVKAMSSEGYWSKEFHYPFMIRPPWWYTSWAYSLYGILFLSVIYSAQRFQKKRIVRAENEKARQKQAILNERLRISRDLHDEVGATLSGIVMYSHLAKSQAKDGNQEVKHSLNIVQETASEMVNKLNDVVWLVNPEQDNLEKLIEKLEDYAGKATESQHIEFKINIPEKMDSISLPIEVRKNIYLFCKEAINNAVKYSGGTLIEFGVSRTDHDIAFTIKDNGIGFDPETVKRGNGLNNLQQRAEEIGADFILSTKPEMGTLFQLKYKIT